MTSPRLTRRDAAVLLCTTAVLTAVKLIFVGSAEIVAQPEQAWYLLAARDGPAVHGVDAYALWIALVHLTGLPLRVAAELLLALGALALALCVVSLGHRLIAAAALIALLLFHPVGFDINDRLDPDTLVAPLMLLAAAAFAQNYRTRATARFVLLGALAGLLLAALWLTTHQAVPLVLWLCTVGAAFYFGGVDDGESRHSAARRALAAAGLPLAIATTVVLLARTAPAPHVPGTMADAAAPSATAVDAAQRSLSSASVAVSKLFQVWIPQESHDHPLTHDSIRSLYDDMANRRPRLTEWRRGMLDGWAFVPGDQLVRAAVREHGGRVLVASDDIIERPDVVAYYSSLPNVPGRSGFLLQVPMVTTVPLELELATRSGRTTVIPISGLIANRRGIVSRMMTTDMRMHFEFMENREQDAPAELRGGRLLRAMGPLIWTYYGALLLVLLGAGLIAFAATLYDTARRRAFQLPIRGAAAPPAALPVILAAAAIIELVTVSVTDAFRAPVVGYQQLYPAMLLTTAVGVLLLSHCFRVWRERRELLHDGPRTTSLFRVEPADGKVRA